VLGAMWTALAMNTIRYVLHKLKIKQFYFGNDSMRKIIIIGDKMEALRVSRLVQLNDRKPEIIETIESESFDTKSILNAKHSYNEIYFCTKSIEIKKVIDIIYALKDKNIEFKIVSIDSDVIISSQEVKIPVEPKHLDTLL
jgi:hypothetical protein